jgi:hypothetical protein
VLVLILPSNTLSSEFGFPSINLEAEAADTTLTSSATAN